MESSRFLLFVDLRSPVNETLADAGRAAGFKVIEAGCEIVSSLEADDVALCVLEAHEDEEVCHRVRQLSKSCKRAPIVVLVRRLRASTVKRLIDLGVAGVIDLPGTPSDIFAQCIQHLAERSEPSETSPIIGESEPLRKVREQIVAVAETESRVLLLGETGTGKGLVARVIHRLSNRRAGRFVHVDCASLSPTIIESELFGHERGAFTGASELRRGRFELAEQGTLFLDEIGDLDARLQAKLLRVLQDRTYERVGGMKTLRMTARIIVATNHDLARAVREGRFRRDLYYRLNVFEIRIPALRERSIDVPPLVRLFVEELAGRLGVAVPMVSDGFYRRLLQHSWPGNVRELVNVIERCLIQRRHGMLSEEDLDGIIDGPGAGSPQAVRAVMAMEHYPDSGPEERRFLEHVLRSAGWNVTRAARRLEMARSTLRYKIRQYGLNELIPRD